MMAQVSTELRQDLLAAASLLRSAKKGVALTGAGISTPSGIPDFRSAGSGLWTRYDPFEVASLSAFRYQPEKFYAWMRSLAIEIVQAQPACESCDLLLVAGSSLEVMPVAGLPLQALEHGSHLILVNQSPTYLDERADF